MRFALTSLCVSALCGLSPLCAREGVISTNKTKPITQLFGRLPPSCETMMYVRPAQADFRPSTNISVENLGDSLLQMPLDALAGLSIDGSWHQLRKRRVRAVVAGATSFRRVQKGPVGVTVCHGCVIIVFEENLGDDGKKYMESIKGHNGRALVVEKAVIIQTNGRLIDGSKGELFTSHPTENTLVFANDIELMKQCLTRMSSADSAYGWIEGHQYFDVDANFVAVSKMKENDDMRVVLNWREDNSSIICITCLMDADGKASPTGFSAQSIRNMWKLPAPVGVMPSIVKQEKDAIWLRLECKNKESSAAASFMTRAHLGFVGIP